MWLNKNEENAGCVWKMWWKMLIVGVLRGIKCDEQWIEVWDGLVWTEGKESCNKTWFVEINKIYLKIKQYIFL